MGRSDSLVLRRATLRANDTGPPLARHFTVAMAAGGMKALGGFRLGSMAPRRGKKANCTADDQYAWPSESSTLQGCFLECLNDGRCENVLVDYVNIVWMEKPPPVRCTLLGAIADPSEACKSGKGTLVKKLVGGRPHAK